MNNKEIEKILANAKATLFFEGMEVDEKMVEIARKYLEGKISEKEVIEMIKATALKKDIQ